MKRRAITFCSVIFPLTLLLAGSIAAQTAPARKDIPAIAKSANGAIVTIITANNDKPIAQGTGFLVSADGVIVTNYHVIENGNVAVVKFPDGAAFPVDGVLASDKVRDLAVIKIHGKTFRTLTLGNSERVQVGEEVVAIGNPLSLESTVSNGIISGVRTSKEQGGKFLQTTAPISPGSSGGPLFNMLGEVVGINTMYLEGGENLNFAIPVNDAKFLLLAKSAKLQNLPNELTSVYVEPDAQGSKTPTEILGWIQTHFETTIVDYMGTHTTNDFVLSFDGCQVTVTWRAHVLLNATGSDLVNTSGPFDLGNLRSEPKQMKVTTEDSIHQLRIYSTKPFLTVMTDSWGGVQRVPDSHNFVLFFATMDMAEKQQKAWHDAIVLCGGRKTHDNLY
jgi:hypothetical protein